LDAIVQRKPLFLWVRLLPAHRSGSGKTHLDSRRSGFRRLRLANPPPRASAVVSLIGRMGPVQPKGLAILKQIIEVR
jgi:hypothetical protein